MSICGEYKRARDANVNNCLKSVTGIKLIQLFKS